MMLGALCKMKGGNNMIKDINVIKNILGKR